MGNRTPIQSALWGKAWSVSSLLFGVDFIHDTAGRPLGERRAPADARRDVPMELARCPYDDEREGGLMNASALKQIIGQFGAVTKEVAAFHATLPAGGSGWEPMFNAVMDQLAAPALHLLGARSESGPVPARAAAGHKLAAGYFGALNRLLAAEARGLELPVSPDSFLEFVHDQRSLIGASEVCAGQPHNLARLTRTFVCGRANTASRVEPWRVTVAQALCSQVRLGLAWKLYDRGMERTLLLGSEAGALTPRTRYLADRIAARVDIIASDGDGGDPRAALPADEVAGGLRALLADGGAGAATASLVAEVDELMALGDGAMTMPDHRVRGRYARHLADILTVYAGFVAAQWQLEQRLRAALGYDLATPVKLSGLMFPDPRTLPLVEIISGHRLLCTPAPEPSLVLRNQHRVVSVGAADARTE